MKFNLVKLLLVLVVVVVLANIVNVVWYGKVSVKGEGYELVVNNQTIKAGSSLKVRPGSYDIVVRGKKIAKTTEKITVNPLGTVSHNKTYKTLTDVQIIANLTGIEQDRLLLYGNKYFENETWLVASIGLKDEDSDSSVLIAQYRAGEWNVIDSGTGIEYDSIPELPASVKNYLQQGENE